MACCKPRTSTPTRLSACKEDIILRIPGAAVHLIEDGEAVELARGDFTILSITDQGVILAIIVRVGPNIQWPLTKDEPVIKLDKLHYLFSLPYEDGSFLNYGVTFSRLDGSLASLDLFLKEHACFYTPSSTSSSPAAPSSYEVYWKDYAPRVEDYNGIVAKAIARGTGEIVKGVFKCSNSYTSQVQKAARVVQSPAVDSKIGISNGGNEVNRKSGGINKAIRKVRELSEMIEKMSQSLLTGVISITGSVAAPLIHTRAAKALFSTAPGEVLLASLDAVGKVLESIEDAERRSLAATSGSIAGAVSKRFGERAGEATEDVFATAGHAVGTVWNVFKIRKALIPSSSIPSGILNIPRKKKT